MSVTVLKPGILSLLQDEGRLGQQQLGLTSGGPMDPEAFYWANRLCDNADNSTAIEVTLGGLLLQFNCYNRVAFGGAAMPLSLNGETLQNWRSFCVTPGDILAVGHASKGCRGYIAIGGGFQVAPVFGSTSTVVREGIGGLNGRALEAGDEIACRSDTSDHCWQLPEAQQPRYSNWLTLRVLPGYQNQSFSRDQQTLFFQNSYYLTQECDRMGYRLGGPPINSSLKGILSEGVCLGAIQIPPDGQPIVMMNDHQTIGGYPKIGSVLSLDLARLAQLKPGDKVNFAAITLESAHKALRLSRANLKATRLQAVSNEC